MLTFDDTLEVLKTLVSLPSFSREEARTAAALSRVISNLGIEPVVHGYNVLARNRHFQDHKPTVLLCSHHDTVRPVAGYTRDPFRPFEENNRLYGLGSNDAGAALVAMLAAFSRYFDRPDLPVNLILLAAAEEEVSGSGGLQSVLPLIGNPALALVGEPTGMQPAVAERGLLVLDGLSQGVAGHAAHGTGKNAIYEALGDLTWFRDHHFEKVSPLLGEVRMTVSSIQAGSQHNVVPAECRFTVDVRTNELYSHDEILAEISGAVRCEIKPRSKRLQSSCLPEGHFMFGIFEEMNLTPFGSPTLSDMALMPFPAVKIGPGSTFRSHTADEYIDLDELRSGIDIYVTLLNKIMEHGL